MREKIAALKAGIPARVERRTVRCPEEVPHYEDYLNFGADSWRELGHGVWTDGKYVLFWTVFDGDSGTLISGDLARTVLQRYGAARERSEGTWGNDTDE